MDRRKKYHSDYEDRNTEIGTPVDPDDVLHILGFDEHFREKWHYKL